MASALEQFARQGGTAAQLKRVFAINPKLESQVLDALSSDPANAGLVLAVASPGARNNDGSLPAWQEKLLNALVARQQYEKAYKVWSQLVGRSVPSGAGLFNPRYRTTSAPPPFNWTFTSSAAGVAEGDRGRLHVMHYGSADAHLAKQLLLLSPGTYEFRMSIVGSIPAEGQLSWSLTCLPSGEYVLRAALRPNSGTLRARFNVPASSCGAQQLELTGLAQEPAGVANVHIGPLQLERVTG